MYIGPYPDNGPCGQICWIAMLGGKPNLLLLVSGQNVPK